MPAAVKEIRRLNLCSLERNRGSPIKKNVFDL